jgi:anti-sigma B factor antagonist
VSDAPAFRVTIDEDEGHVVVSIVGDLDAHRADALDGAIDDALAEERSLVINLRDTTFIGSVGIAGIVRAHRRLSPSGSSVRVIPGRPIHRRIFEVTGLDEIIEIDGGGAAATT